MGKLLILAALMTTGAEPTIPADAVKPGQDKERLICRREVPIGSLIASRKICLTLSQWDKRAVDGQSTAYKLMMEGMGRGGPIGGTCTGRDC